MAAPWRTVPEATVLAFVAKHADASGFIEKVVLFGSRARGEARPFSDYDLAVTLSPEASHVTWLALAETMDDEAPTLCRLSLVQFRTSLRPELRANIAREGVVVYER